MWAALIVAVSCGSSTSLRREECGQCTPRQERKPATLCAVHEEEVEEGLAEARRSIRSEDPARRRQALEAAAALNGSHTNAPAKEVAAFLAASLDDEAFPVRTRAVELLGAGQEPDTAIKALVKNLPEVAAVLGQIKASHADAEAAMAFAVASIRSVAAWRDDRVAEALIQLLKRSPASLYGAAVTEMITRLGDIGTQGTIEALIRYDKELEGLAKFPNAERMVHDRLTRLAAEHDQDGAPEWNESGVASAWGKWFKSHRRAFPARWGEE